MTNLEKKLKKRQGMIPTIGIHKFPIPDELLTYSEITKSNNGNLACYIPELKVLKALEDMGVSITVLEELHEDKILYNIQSDTFK